MAAEPHPRDADVVMAISGKGALLFISTHLQRKTNIGKAAFGSFRVGGPQGYILESNEDPPLQNSCAVQIPSFAMKTLPDVQT